MDGERRSTLHWTEELLMIPMSSRLGPIILAHRGGDEVASENSYEAFDNARTLGVRHIETDVHLSADGRVVISHDPTVDRCFNGVGRIADLTWRELSKLEDSHGAHMLLLEEALDAFPDMYFNIDAKVDGVEGPLVEIIADANAFDRVVLASFSESRLRWIRARAAGRVSTSIGMSAVTRLVAAAKTASKPRLWRIPGPHQGVFAAQVPISYGPLRVVDRRFVAAAHTAGLAVHVWTVDEPEEILSLIELGVDGIVTNRPHFVRDFLAERGMWEAPPAPGARGQLARD